MTIGERIKFRRRELGLSVDEVANALEKNRATIYRYESNDIEKLPITVLEPLARVLKTTPAKLMGWNDTSEERKLNDLVLISKHELNIINSYRNKPELQPIVDKILDVIENDKFKLYSVARCSDSKPDGIIEFTKEQYNRLKNTPETDDDL